MKGQVLHKYTNFKYVIVSCVLFYVATQLLVFTKGIKGGIDIWKQEVCTTHWVLQIRSFLKKLHSVHISCVVISSILRNCIQGFRKRMVGFKVFTEENVVR